MRCRLLTDWPTLKSPSPAGLPTHSPHRLVMKVRWMDAIGAVDVRAAADAGRSRIWADLVTEFGPTEHHAGGSPLIASARATTTIGPSPTSPKRSPPGPRLRSSRRPIESPRPAVDTRTSVPNELRRSSGDACLKPDRSGHHHSTPCTEAPYRRAPRVPSPASTAGIFAVPTQRTAGDRQFVFLLTSWTAASTTVRLSVRARQRNQKSASIGS